MDEAGDPFLVLSLDTGWDSCSWPSCSFPGPSACLFCKLSGLLQRLTSQDLIIPSVNDPREMGEIEEMGEAHFPQWLQVHASG